MFEKEVQEGRKDFFLKVNKQATPIWYLLFEPKGEVDNDLETSKRKKTGNETDYKQTS